MNTAIIVAAGSGTRFDSEIPKQFIEINGKPLIMHALERFEKCSSVNAIVLVLAEDRIENFKSSRWFSGLTKLSKIVIGGPSRAESVLNGLKAVDRSTDIVAVHDGARPFVTSDEISRTISKAKEVGAACLVTSVTDTIKGIDGDRIVETVDRRRLRRALTPQAFRYDIIVEAFEKADLTETVTDECFLVEKIGKQIGIVPGSSRNIKITHADDLLLAEAFLRED